MTKRSLILALVSLLSAVPAWTQEYIQSGAQSQLKSIGFSDSFIAKVNRNRTDPYHLTLDGNAVMAQQDSLPPIQAPEISSGPSSTPTLEPISNPAGATGGDQTSETGQTTTSGQPTTPDQPLSATATNPDQSASAKPAAAVKTKKNGKNGTVKKSSKSGNSKTTKKSTKKKKSTAPVVQSMPDASIPALPSPYGAETESGQEIYSQEPLKLPPVSSLPVPSRTTLPPISRDEMMLVPLGEAVTRILACNFMGLTGLLQTTSADVSKEGSFKCGFHSSWFALDRVYDRVLASGESGEILQIPLFFNYAVTNDLEFAFMLPVENYTIKSRILWSKDFRVSGVGDCKLSFKYRVFDNPQYQMRGAFGLGFKFPTGSDLKGLGTGKTDFEIYTAFSKNFERIVAHLNLGYVMTGDPNTTFYPNGLADIFYYNIGLEYPHNHNVTIMTEVNGQDWGAEGLRIDVTPGLRYTPTDNFAFEVGVPIAVTNDQRYGYNYRLVFGVTSFFK